MMKIKTKYVARKVRIRKLIAFVEGVAKFYERPSEL